MALTDGLVAYWKLDGNANDAVGSNNGTVDGASVTSAAVFNSAYSFDGSNDNIEFTPVLAGSTQFTISLWHYRVTDTGSYERIIAENSGSNNWNFYLHVKNNDKLYWAVQQANGSIYGNYDGKTSITTQQWRHIVLTRSASRETLYINAVADGSSSSDYTTGALRSSGVSHLNLGSDSNSANFEGQKYIDEVGIWSRALEPSEITALYNNGLGLPYPFTGWTHKFNGVTNATLGKINTVSKASISKVNTV